MASFSRASTGRNNNNLSPRTRRNQARARRTNGEVRRVGLAMGADEATVAIVDSWVKNNPYLIHQIEASFFFGMKLQYNFLEGNMNKDQVDTCKSLYGLSGDTDSDNGAANRQAAEGMFDTFMADNNNRKHGNDGRNVNNVYNNNNNDMINNDEAIAKMLATSDGANNNNNNDFIGINLMSNNNNNMNNSNYNNQTQVDLDAELARQLQNGDNDIGRRYDAARFRNNNRNGNRGRGGTRRGRGRSNNRRRVRVYRNNNNNNNNNARNGWQDAGLFFQNVGVSDNRFNTYEEMLALDENNVKVGLKKNVSNSIFYYNIILI